MTFHRLNANPAGYDAFPVGYDFINNPAANGDAGVPANTDGKKVGGPNAGTYYVGFGEDATSSDANRGMLALSQNTDFLDNAIRKPLAMPTRTVDAVAGAPVTTINLPDVSGVFIGSGTDAIPETLLTLFSVLDDKDDEIIDPTTGVRCDVTAIGGVPLPVVGTGFSAGTVSLTITPAIPTGTTYRVYYANKSNLLNMPTDALTVIKIRGAQELPAGFEDFQKQISRMIGTNIVAVVGTMFETPDGTRLTRSNSMSFEVDPDGTVGPIHRFFWRKARDTGTPLTVFEVNDDTSLGGVAIGRVRLASGYVLEAVGTGLLRDANIAAGAAQGGAFIPWTSSTAALGDKFLRVFEVGSVGSAITPTIFRSLNSKWTVTVGDGTASFGDFSGVDAIQQALAYVAAVATTASIHIKLKKGGYTISDVTGVLSFGSNLDVTLEGVNPTDTVITTSSTAAPISAAASAIIRFKNLAVFRSGGSTTGLTDVGPISVKAENCFFQDFSFLLLDPSVLDVFGVPTQAKSVYFSHCVFSTSGLGVPAITMQFGSNRMFAGYDFVDCAFFINDSNTPAVRIQAKTAMAADAIARGFRFERTDFYTGSSSITGGNPDGPSGPIDLKSNGTTFGANGLRLTDVTFKDCNVFAGGAKSSDATVQLLYITPYDGTGTIRLDEFTIDGGKWMINKNSPSLLPFWVGSGAGYTDFDTGNHRPHSVSIKNIATGWSDPGDYSGSGTTSTTTYGTAPTVYNGGGLAVTSVSAYFISSGSVEVKKVKFVGTCGSSLEAELWIDGALTLDVDNIDLLLSTTVAGVKPDYRIKIVPTGQAVGAIPSVQGAVRRVRNVILDGNSLANGTLNSVGGTHEGGLLLIPYGHLEVESCVVRNVNGGTSDMGGARMPLLDHFYTIDNAAAQGLKIRHCRFINNRNAGFTIVHGGTISYATTSIADFEFTDNYMTSNTVNGFAVYGNDGAVTCSFPNALIADNTAFDNHQPDPQMMFYPSAFMQVGSLTISGNRCGSTAGAAPVGLAFGTLKAALAVGEVLCGSIVGNSMWSGVAADGVGNIGLRIPSGGAFTWNENTNYTLYRVRGLHIGYTIVGGLIYRQWNGGGTLPTLDNDGLLTQMP